MYDQLTAQVETEFAHAERCVTALSRAGQPQSAYWLRLQINGLQVTLREIEDLPLSRALALLRETLEALQIARRDAPDHAVRIPPNSSGEKNRPTL